MAEYPALSFADLSSFSGRDLSTYDVKYSTTAIAQATLLFKVATCLSALPETDTYQYDLAKTAIIAMADQLVLAQPYVASMASPFTSETIGSYSYSKMAQQIQSKERTGVMWFDIATQELGVCNEMDQAFFYGGIEVMEHDGKFARGSGSQGNLKFLSARDLMDNSEWLGAPYKRNPYTARDDQQA